MADSTDAVCFAVSYRALSDLSEDVTQHLSQWRWVVPWQGPAPSTGVATLVRLAVPGNASFDLPGVVDRSEPGVSVTVKLDARARGAKDALEMMVGSSPFQRAATIESPSSKNSRGVSTFRATLAEPTRAPVRPAGSGMPTPAAPSSGIPKATTGTVLPSAVPAGPIPKAATSPGAASPISPPAPRAPPAAAPIPKATTQPSASAGSAPTAPSLGSVASSSPTSGSAPTFPSLSAIPSTGTRLSVADADEDSDSGYEDEEEDEDEESMDDRIDAYDDYDYEDEDDDGDPGTLESDQDSEALSNFRTPRPGDKYVVYVLKYRTIYDYTQILPELEQNARVIVPYVGETSKEGDLALLRLKLPGRNIFEIWALVGKSTPEQVIIHVNKESPTFLKAVVFPKSASGLKRVGTERPEHRGPVNVIRMQEERKENLDDIPLKRRLSRMTMEDKVNMALSGTREERMALAMDGNKAIHHYLLKNARISVDEIAFIARLPTMNPDVLAKIGENPTYLQNLSVVKNLIYNPKTPITLSIRLLDRLPRSEVMNLAKRTSMNGRLVQAAKKKIEGRMK